MRFRESHQGGYSLAEILVVVGIVGLMVLVSLPNIMQMMKSNEMRSSASQFNADLRNLRQLAITRSAQVKVSFSTGGTSRSYDAELSTDGGASWTAISGSQAPFPRSLGDSAYFHATTFVDVDTDGRPDVVFLPNGTIDTPLGVSQPTITVRSVWSEVTYNQYSFQFTTTGRIQVTKSHV